MDIFAAFMGLKTGFKILVIAIIFGLGFGAGIYIANTFHDAAETKKLKAQIKDRDAAIEIYNQALKDIADKMRARGGALIAANKKMDDLNQQIEGSYEKTPANNNDCIAPVRVRLINEQRATANNIRP